MAVGTSTFVNPRQCAQGLHWRPRRWLPASGRKRQDALTPESLARRHSNNRAGYGLDICFHAFRRFPEAVLEASECRDLVVDFEWETVMRKRRPAMESDYCRIGSSGRSGRQR